MVPFQFFDVEINLLKIRILWFNVVVKGYCSKTEDELKV
jgi:hypothetical protein